jgi:hypothetical protein
LLLVCREVTPTTVFAASLIQFLSIVAVVWLTGGGGYILTQADYVNAFFSHDEYVDFFAKLDSNLLEVRKELGNCRSDRFRVPATDPLRLCIRLAISRAPSDVPFVTRFVT